MISRTEKDAQVRLVFADDLTATTFDWMRDKLAEALSSSDSVLLELGNIRCVDRSLVELMCSAHRVADSLGKSFTFSSDETLRQIQELACDSGYADIPCDHRTTGCLYQGRAAVNAMKEEE